MSETCTLLVPYCQIFPITAITSPQTFPVTLAWSNVAIPVADTPSFSTPSGLTPVLRLVNNTIEGVGDSVAVDPTTVSWSSTGLSFTISVTMASTSYDTSIALLVNLQVSIPMTFDSDNSSVTLSPIIAVTNFSSPSPFVVTCASEDHQLHGSSSTPTSSYTYPTDASVTWSLSGVDRREKVANGYKFTQNLTTTPSSNPSPLGGTGLIPVTIGHQPSTDT